MACLVAPYKTPSRSEIRRLIRKDKVGSERYRLLWTGIFLWRHDDFFGCNACFPDLGIGTCHLGVIGTCHFLKKMLPMDFPIFHTTRWAMPVRCWCDTCSGRHVCRQTFVRHGSRHTSPDDADHEVKSLPRHTNIQPKDSFFVLFQRLFVLSDTFLT